MARKVSNAYQIPFDSNGNQLHYPASYGTIAWADNCSFSDSLKIDRLISGHSAKYYNAVSTVTKKKFTIFARDLIDIVQHAEIKDGIMTGTWTFVKRGRYFGVAILENNPEDENDA